MNKFLKTYFDNRLKRAISLNSTYEFTNFEKEYDPSMYLDFRKTVDPKYFEQYSSVIVSQLILDIPENLFKLKDHLKYLSKIALFRIIERFYVNFKNKRNKDILEILCPYIKEFNESDVVYMLKKDISFFNNGFFEKVISCGAIIDTYKFLMYARYDIVEENRDIFFKNVIDKGLLNRIKATDYEYKRMLDDKWFEPIHKYLLANLTDNEIERIRSLF